MVTSTVTPWCDSASIRRQNCRRDSGSTPPVGSSRKTIAGSWRIAQPSARRCRQPPARSRASASSRPGQPGHLEHERAGAPPDARGSSRRCRRRTDVLIDGQQLVEREALRHVADALLDAFGIASHVDAVRPIAVPDVGSQQSAQHADGRGLPGAVAAEEAEDLAAPDVERQSVDGDERAEAPRQAADLDGVRPVGRWIRMTASAADRACQARSPSRVPARVRSSSACSSAVCASSTSVLVRRRREALAQTRARFGGGAHAVVGGGDGGAARLELELALPDLERDLPIEIRQARLGERAPRRPPRRARRARRPSQSVQVTLTTRPRSRPTVAARKDARVRPRVVVAAVDRDLRAHGGRGRFRARAHAVDPIRERAPLGPRARWHRAISAIDVAASARSPAPAAPPVRSGWTRRRRAAGAGRLRRSRARWRPRSTPAVRATAALGPRAARSAESAPDRARADRGRRRRCDRRSRQHLLGLRAVTSAQNARVISSRRSARAAVRSLAGRLALGARRALERVGAAAGVDRPLQVEPRPVVVGHVGIDACRS